MQVNIEFNEDDLKRLVLNHIRQQFVNLEEDIKEVDLKFMVKTSQNYKADWEQGRFKVVLSKNI